MEENFQEDWLDARLRDEATYIDDAGFTARVMQNLPARRTRNSFRAWILFCVTILASITTYTVSGGGKFLVDDLHQFANLPLLWIFILAAVCSVILSSIATAAAINALRGERLS